MLRFFNSLRFFLGGELSTMTSFSMTAGFVGPARAVKEAGALRECGEAGLIGTLDRVFRDGVSGGSAIVKWEWK